MWLQVYQMPKQHYNERRCWCAELSQQEKNLVIKVQLISMSNTDTTSRHASAHRHSDTQPREREYTTYLHQGLHVCRKMFLFLHNTRSRAIKNIRRSCRADGFIPRVHGNTRQLPPNALTLDETTQVVSFIQQYAEDNAIMLRGRIPGYKRTNLQLLPCHTTKCSVWEKYTSDATQLSGVRSVAYSTFC